MSSRSDFKNDPQEILIDDILMHVRGQQGRIKGIRSSCAINFVAHQKI